VIDIHKTRHISYGGLTCLVCGVGAARTLTKVGVDYYIETLTKIGWVDRDKNAVEILVDE